MNENVTPKNNNFLQAAKNLPHDTIPVWLMRQAGRYMKEYRDVKEKVSFLELCKSPDLVTEVTMQPIQAFAFDAAIIFSDILIPCEALGMELFFSDNSGPQFKNPIRNSKDLERLSFFEPQTKTPFVFESIQKVNTALDNQIPLLGFAGAPFTLATYMVEGKTSKQFIEIKKFLYQYPDTAKKLLTLLSDTIARYLRAQIEAGVHAIQLFDSWGGILAADEFEQYSLPYIQNIFSSLKDIDVPKILYVNNSHHLLSLQKNSGATVISLDWRSPIDEAIKILGDNLPVQGNLDPSILYADKYYIKMKTLQILDAVKNRNGFIFNLGHGVLKTTPVENVKYLVELLHAYKP